MTTRELLRLEHITKHSGSLKVLDDLSLFILEGERVQVTGLSGSGIEELSQILSGRSSFDSGRIRFEERSFGPEQLLPALELGIHVVNASPSLVPAMSVAENIFCLRPHAPFMKTPSRRILRQQAKRLLEEFGLDIPPEASVYELRLVEQQALDFVRAYARGAKLILLTDLAGPYPDDLRRIFDKVTRHLQKKNVAILSLSHDPAENFDRTIVLRDGSHAKTIYQQFPSRGDVMRYAVEGELPEPAPRKSNVQDIIAFRCFDLQVENVKNINFSVRRGEIVGIFDSANTDLYTGLEAVLTGAKKAAGGYMLLGGSHFAPKDLSQAVKAGLGYINGNHPEAQLIEHISVAENILLPSMKKVPLLGLFRNPSVERSIDNTLDEGELRGLAHVSAQDLPEHDDLAKTLILYHRWGIYRPKLLLYADPFSHTDQVLRSKILTRIEHLTSLDIGVLVLSPRLKDLVYLCDRILIYKDGIFQQSLEKKENQFPGLHQIPR